MGTILLYEWDANDNEDILKADLDFLENCEISKNNCEAWIVEISDKWWNNIKLWDHQRDSFIN